ETGAFTFLSFRFEMRINKREHEEMSVCGELTTGRTRGALFFTVRQVTRRSHFIELFAVLLIASLCSAGCRKGLLDKTSVVPRSLRDVPAQKLAYNFQA